MKVKVDDLVDLDKLARLAELLSENKVENADICDWLCWGVDNKNDKIGYDIFVLLNMQIYMPYSQAMFLAEAKPNEYPNIIAELEEKYRDLPQDIVSYMKEKNHKLSLYREIGKIALEQAPEDKKPTINEFEHNDSVKFLQACVRENNNSAIQRIKDLIIATIKDYKLHKNDIPESFRDTPIRGESTKTPNVSRGFLEIGKRTIAALSVLIRDLPEAEKQEVKNALIDPKVRLMQ